MDISLPYKWIKEYVDTNLSASDFASALSLKGPSIEKWHRAEILDDDILEIEVTPNRVDMASVIGIAREASAILNTSLNINVNEPNYPQESEKNLEIENQNLEKCPKYLGVLIDGIEMNQTPDWMKKRLEELGMNSINILVDISNYVLLEYGQPTHIFDYDKVENGKIIIRNANEGEGFVTLDNREIELNSDDLVIADNSKVLGLAGVKGGISSGVNTNTKTIVIEAATFEGPSVRRSARRHDLQTDASSLFEKGLNTQSTHAAMNRVIELVLEHAGGRIVSPLVDSKKNDFENRVINFNRNLIPRILGIEIDESQIEEILNSLGFEVENLGEGNMNVKVPFYRNEDVIYDFDLVEEIARIYGYDNIPSILPDGEIPIYKSDAILSAEDKAKDILAGIGLTEIFSNEMVGDEELKLTNLTDDDVIAVANPLTVEAKYMRRDLLSTLFTFLSNNETYQEKIKAFEIANIYIPNEGNLPTEQSTLSLLVNGKNEDVYFETKGYFEHLLRNMNPKITDFLFERYDDDNYFEKGSGALIKYKDELVGKIGLISKKTRKKLGIKSMAAVLEVNFQKFNELSQNSTKSFAAIPKYPSVARDFAVLLDSKIAWQEIKDSITNINTEIIENIDFIEDYRGRGIEENKKSITFRVTLRDENKTLSEEEINNAVKKINSSINALGGEVR